MSVHRGLLILLGNHTGFIDQVSGGDVAKRLAKVPELEITVPNRHDRLILTAEVHYNASHVVWT